MQLPKMRLRLASRAQTDIAAMVEYIAAIVEYGVDRFGAKRAKEYVERIEQRFGQLRDSRRLGEARANSIPASDRCPCGSHRIFYSIDGDTITIPRLLHNAADVKGWLK